MQGIVGVLASDRVAVALVAENRVSGLIRLYPEPGVEAEPLAGLHAEDIIDLIAREVRLVTKGQPLDAIGVGFPGIIRDGVVEESPNLQQAKGCRLQERLAALLNTRVLVLNDADAIAAGIAATRRPAGDAGPGVDAGRGHRIWPLSPVGGSLGRRAHGGQSRSQRALLRLRRRWPFGRHHGPCRHAPPLSGFGAGRGFLRRRKPGTRAALLL